MFDVFIILKLTSLCSLKLSVCFNVNIIFYQTSEKNVITDQHFKKEKCKLEMWARPLSIFNQLFELMIFHNDMTKIYRNTQVVTHSTRFVLS